MRRPVAAALGMLLLAGTASAQQDSVAGGNSAFLSLWAGGRTYGDFNDLDDGMGGSFDLGDHFAFGLEYHTVSQNGFGWEVGAAFSSGVDSPPAGVDDPILFEVLLGARYTYPHAGRFLPYIGGGADVLFPQFDAASGGLSARTDDTDFGAYGRVGVSYLFGDHLTLGLEARSVFATSDDLDYSQLALVLGWGVGRYP